MKRNVYITGIGLIKGQEEDSASWRLAIKREQYEEIIPGLKYKNADRISMIGIAAAKAALDNAGIDYNHDLEDVGLFFGSMYGPLNSIHGFDSVSVNEGALYVNPSLFPNTVLNSPACEISIQYNITGPVYTLYNGFSSSIDAVGLGYNYVANNLCNKVLAGGADEVSDFPFAPQNKAAVEASGFLVLESDPGDLSKRNIEIVGYDTFPVSNIEDDSFCFELSSKISDILKSTDIKGIEPGELRIYSALSECYTDKISKKICTDNGIDLKNINCADYFGMGSIFDVICCINENSNSMIPYNESKYEDLDNLLKKMTSNILCIILSIDEYKASMLYIKIRSFNT